jgi:hypothetical protein
MTNEQLVSFLKSIGCEAQANDAPSLAFARKMIEALAEPTEASFDAGHSLVVCNPLDGSDMTVGACDVERLWTAMFQARFRTEATG